MKAPEATISVLMMSVASSAAMSLGLAPHPDTGKTETDKQMAKFNIDLLVVIKDKTKGNLSTDESQFLDHVLLDLQTKFLEMK